MKLIKKDKVLVISGKYKGKKGEIVAVLPKTNQVVIEGVNVAKKHLKPSQINPKGGIVEVTKPISSSKVMVLDPKTGKPARVGYKISASGKKERIFKVSSFKNKPATKPAKKTTTKKTTAKKTEVKK